MAGRYREIVVVGPRGFTLGFIEGFLRGRGVDGDVLDAEREGFDVASLRERVRELLHPKVDTLHLLTPETLAPAVREAVGAAALRGASMAIRHERPLAGARFSFSFAVYSRPHAERIRGYFEHLPEGARLSPDSSFVESLHPDEIGVEVYAPAHDYDLRGKGTVVGSMEGVLSLYRTCRDEELIRESPVELLGEGKS